VLVVATGFLLNISPTEWIFVLSAGFFVLGAEVANTSVERLVDLIEPKRNINCKLVKDITAGLVMIVCIYAAIVGGIVFIPKLIALL